jgi:hypothetical protein
MAIGLVFPACGLLELDPVPTPIDILAILTGGRLLLVFGGVAVARGPGLDDATRVDRPGGFGPDERSSVGRGIAE